jgi:hypothetical protein
VGSRGDSQLQHLLYLLRGLISDLPLLTRLARPARAPQDLHVASPALPATASVTAIAEMSEDAKKNPPATSLYRQQNPLAGGPTARDLSLHADCLPACKGVDGQLYPSGHHRACPHHSSNRKVAPQELASPDDETLAEAGGGDVVDMPHLVCFLSDDSDEEKVRKVLGMALKLNVLDQAGVRSIRKNIESGRFSNEHYIKMFRNRLEDAGVAVIEGQAEVDWAKYSTESRAVHKPASSSDEEAAVIVAANGPRQKKKTMLMQATGERTPQSKRAAVLFVVAYLVFGALVIGITFAACKVRPLRHLFATHPAMVALSRIATCCADHDAG